MSKITRGWSIARAAFALLAVGTAAQAPMAQSAAVPTVATASAAPAPPPAITPPMTGQQIIELLDQTIDWYRTLGVEQQAANEPSDLLILYDNRQTAAQVIAYAFEMARAAAAMLGKQSAGKDAGTASSASQSIGQLQSKFAAQAAAAHAELDSTKAQLARARGTERPRLQARMTELQGDLDLIAARRSLLATIAAFGSESGNGFGGSSLKAQIDAMAATAPGIAGTNAAGAGAGAAGTAAGASATGTTPAASAGAPVLAPTLATPAAVSAPAAPVPVATALTTLGGIAAARFGIWDLAANVIRLSEKAATVGEIDQRTAALQSAFARIRTPLIAQLQSLSARGDALAAQADSADSATLKSVGGQLDVLSSEFKESSTLLIPLSKEGVLLGQYRRNLGNWRDTVNTQYGQALRTLLVRVAVLAVLLVIVFTAAEIWRKAVLRYIADSRRRYQFLLLRRIALWSLVVLIVGFAFASELGSVVTFAGLITAGLAVAMQGVLMSIVGYFFLIGKYGIRVGDRVQIGEVTGEVIDLGLVRMHLMELGEHGTLGPTGRVVAFANSVVFQVSSGLFKQIHGVTLVWREITSSLPDGVDSAEAKSRLTAAVNDALRDDHPEIMRQTREIQRATASNSTQDAQARVQLSFSAAGIEAHIRYPVHLQNAAEIDERVSQAAFGVVRDLMLSLRAR